MAKYRVLLLYHYFHPDDVVSAHHVSELALGLAQRGWDVSAAPCNRGCRDESKFYPRRESWRGVNIRRIWRPGIPQASLIGRLFNAAWMIIRWSLLALKANSPDILIIGTDPILSVTVARFWKLVRPRTRVIHWCFDLYPEAAIADGLLKPQSAAVRVLKSLLRPAYRACDLIVDIGSCMRERLAEYASPAKMATLTPWALSEPAAPATTDRDERALLFPGASLALMYSGNFGRAHSFHEILELARRLRGDNVRLVFSVRGNREQALRAAVQQDDATISFCGFAAPDQLEQRLSAADIHVISLRPEWTGMVVPSKFFGAIAAGRPVLFAGSRDSAVARWIERYKLGWVLTSQNITEVAEQFRCIASSPEAILKMRKHCFEIYHAHFSRDHIVDAFDAELRALLNRLECAPESLAGKPEDAVNI